MSLGRYGNFGSSFRDVIRDSADQKSLTVSLPGEHSILSGVSGLLFELAYNLCDNAVKYNREGGEIWICLEKKSEGIRLTVEDTGIGQGHLPRIFERFYRVDKSRARSPAAPVSSMQRPATTGACLLRVPPARGPPSP